MRNLEFSFAIILTLCSSQSLNAQEGEKGTETLSRELVQLAPVTSFVVEQSGHRIIEQYSGRMHADRTTNIKSASKGIISLLVGIAINRGYIKGIHQPIVDFFPDYFKQHPDPEKEAITIQDLLTMRAGLASTSRRHYGRWVLSDNWAAFALARPMIEERGGTMVYSTGTTHLLSVILTRATGMSTLAFANQYLFGPLKIRVGGWDKDPQGYYFGGNNLALSPNSMIKIGTLVMNKGMYEEKQLVPAAWIEESMQTYTRSNFNPYDFGYHWWHRKSGNHRIQFAWGNGGQFIFMLPELKTVIAITSTSKGTFENRDSRQKLFEYLEFRLIPYLTINQVQTD